LPRVLLFLFGSKDDLIRALLASPRRRCVTGWTCWPGRRADGVRETPDGLARRTAVLAVLRGGLLDLLATGDVERTTAAVHRLLPAGPG
jgi:hypothetical protein